VKTTRTLKLPGLDGKPVEAEYEPHEYAEIEAMYAHARSLPKGEEQDQVIHSIRTLHELKVTCGARILSEGDMRERGLTVETLPRIGREEPVVRDDGPIQTTMLAPDTVDPNSPFQMPATARRKLGMVDADGRDNTGRTTTDEALPDPSANRIGKFHAPEHGAPDTQRRAAIETYPTSGKSRWRVLCEIAMAGENGCTTHEVALSLDKPYQGVNARRNELMNDGFIEDSGRTRRTVFNRDAAVYVLTDGGRSWWKESGQSEWVAYQRGVA
jgi:hypothetical protein